MRELLIISLIILGIIIFIILWVWRFIFQKSLRKLVLSMLAIAQDRDALVDPDAEIFPNQDVLSSEVLEAKAQQVKAQMPFEPHKPLPKAHFPADDTSEWLRDTSDSGWPRALDYESRHEPHPFRQVHLRTRNEETHEIMDADTFVDPDVEGDTDND